MTATPFWPRRLAPDRIVRHLNGMRRRDLLIRLGLLGGGVAGAWWVRDHLLWPAPDVRFSGEAWLPWAAPRIPLPIAEATVGGVKTRALIDSGAQYSVIDRGLYERMGRPPTVDLPTVAYGLSGRPQLGKGATVEVRLGDAHMPRVRAAILDLGPLAAAEGVGTPLILGQDVLGKAVLDLDLADRRLRLLPPGAARPDRVSPVAVRKDGRALGVEVTVEGASIPAIIDTGASAAVAVGREAAEGAGLLDGRETRRGSSLVFGGALASTQVTARTVTIGDRLFRDVDLAIYDDVALPGFPAALIGMGAFAGQRVVLDLGGGRMDVSREMDLTVGAANSD